jgi:hypothetical protein
MILVNSSQALGPLVEQPLPALAKLSRVIVDIPREGDVALYVANLISGLFDFENSDFDKSPNGYVVYRTVMKSPEALTEQIFRIPENPMVLFVTKEFKDAVLLSGLKGLVFREVEILVPNT